MGNALSYIPLLNKYKTHNLLRPMSVIIKERLAEFEEVTGKICNRKSIGWIRRHHFGNVTVFVEISLYFQRGLTVAGKHS